jgi:hypothetical protein
MPEYTASYPTQQKIFIVTLRELQSHINMGIKSRRMRWTKFGNRCRVTPEKKTQLERTGRRRVFLSMDKSAVLNLIIASQEIKIG